MGLAETIIVCMSPVAKSKEVIIEIQDQAQQAPLSLSGRAVLKQQDSVRSITIRQGRSA